MSGFRSIYDGDADEDDEATPWFLPPADEARETGDPRAVAALVDAADTATARAGAALFEIGRLHGRLDEAVRLGAPVVRLRAMEISDLMWRSGSVARAEKIALYELDGGVVRGGDRDADAFAAWCLRRLRTPVDPGHPEAIRDWLGRRGPLGDTPDEAGKALAAIAAANAALARSPAAGPGGGDRLALASLAGAGARPARDRAPLRGAAGVARSDRRRARFRADRDRIQAQRPGRAPRDRRDRSGPRRYAPRGGKGVGRVIRA